MSNLVTTTSQVLKVCVYLEYEKTTNPITPIAFGIC